MSEQTRDNNSLWLSHERAVSGVHQVIEANQQVASTLARHRATLESSLEHVRTASTRCEELKGEVRRTTDVLERLLILSMNASLDGARQAEGSPLILLGDEVRSHARRGLETLGELRTSTDDLGAATGEALRLLEQAKEGAGTLLSDAGRTGAAAVTVERTLEDVREVLRRTTGTDPETMKVLGEAAEHAKALVSSIGTLSGKMPKSLVASVLRPTIEPLLSMLAEDDEEPAP